MHNFFSGSWRRDTASPGSGMRTTSFGSAAGGGGGANLDGFFEDVESIVEELRGIEHTHRSLHESNESLKTLHSPATVRELRTRMNGEVARVMKKAKVVKVRLEALDRSNAANRSVQGCGPGSSTDRTRTSVVAGLRKKLMDQMNAFGELRRRVGEEHRQAVARRYYAVTGENADEPTVDAIAAADGEEEEILRAALQGKGAVEAAVAEMRERKGAVEQLERSLLELHQVFLDMAILVEEQGHQIDDIESQVERASSFIDRGVHELHHARRHQMNTRNWTCFAVVLLIVIILLILLPIVLKK